MIPTCKCARKSQQRQMVSTDLLTTVLLLTRKKKSDGFSGQWSRLLYNGTWTPPPTDLMKVRAPQGQNMQAWGGLEGTEACLMLCQLPQSCKQGLKGRCAHQGWLCSPRLVALINSPFISKTNSGERPDNRPPELHV